MPHTHADNCEVRGKREAAGAALKRLEAGIRRLGRLVVLEEKAVELEVSLNRREAALKRLDGVIADMKKRKLRFGKWEKWRTEIAR